MIFGINTTSDTSKLLYLVSRAVRQVKFEIILKYHKWYLCQYQVQILLLFVYTTTHKRFVIFTLSWNTTTLSQSNCRNFLHSSIITERSINLPFSSLQYQQFLSHFHQHLLLLLTDGKKIMKMYIMLYLIFLISGYFYFSFLSTSLSYISIPKNKRKKQKLPEIKKINYVQHIYI